MAHSICIIGKKKSETNIRLLEEAKRHFDSVFFVPIDSIGMGLGESVSIHYRASDIRKFNAIMPRIPKQFATYAHQLLSLFPEETYMVSKPASLLLSSERFLLMSTLKSKGLPTLNMHFAKSARAAAGVIKEISYPVIIRSPERRTGVVVKNPKEARSVIDALVHINQPFMIEDLVKEMVSVYVAYPEVLGSTRKTTSEMDAVFSKGKISRTKIPANISKLALDAASVLEAGIAKVDIATDGEPRIANIELNPNLVKPGRVIGVDMPRKAMEIIHSNYLKHTHRPGIHTKIIGGLGSAKTAVRGVLKTGRPSKRRVF